MIVKAALGAALGSLLWLDRFQIFQVLVSRPIIAAPAVGWISGDLSSGLAVGLLYEMLWLRRPPVGGYIPPDATLASIATAAVTASVRLDTGMELLAASFLSFLILFPMCFVGSAVDGGLRSVLGRVATAAEQAELRGADVSLYAYFLVGLAAGYVLTFLVLFPAIVGGTLVVKEIAGRLPERIQHALGLAFYAVPLVGISDLLQSLERVSHRLLFIIGFGVAILAGLFLRFFG